MDARTVQAVAWDFLRHDFCGRELRVLLLILFRLDGDGKAHFERKIFEDRLGLRSDKALLVLRELQSARVLKPGWENGEFVIDPHSDSWKRAELAPRAALAQASLPMESGDDGVRFAHAIARENFGELAARAKSSADPAGQNVRSTEAGTLPGTSHTQSGECFPNLGKNGGIEKRAAAESIPQIGERSTQPALVQAGAGFPKMGNAVLPQNGEGNVVQPLNVSSKERTLERCTVIVTNPPPSHAPSAYSERELIARTRSFVGEEDWSYWGGCWVKHVVRKIPRILERALADRESQVKEGRTINHRGKALWYACKEFGANPKALFGQ